MNFDVVKRLWTNIRSLPHVLCGEEKCEQSPSVIVKFSTGCNVASFSTRICKLQLVRLHFGVEKARKVLERANRSKNISICKRCEKIHRGVAETSRFFLGGKWDAQGKPNTNNGEITKSNRFHLAIFIVPCSQSSPDVFTKTESPIWILKHPRFVHLIMAQRLWGIYIRVRRRVWSLPLPGVYYGDNSNLSIRREISALFVSFPSSKIYLELTSSAKTLNA